MKTPDKQIVAMLQAFKQENVLKAISLYQEGLLDKFADTTAQLKNEGWLQVESEPKDREFYNINDTYWVQTDEARDKDIVKMIKLAKGKPSAKKESMSLKLINIKCPTCNNRMYKQSVCSGCTEGKNGYKIRLICEDNSDHEVLL